MDIAKLWILEAGKALLRSAPDETVTTSVDVAISALTRFAQTVPDTELAPEVVHATAVLVRVPLVPAETRLCKLVQAGIVCALAAPSRQSATLYVLERLAAANSIHCEMQVLASYADPATRAARMAAIQGELFGVLEDLCSAQPMCARGQLSVSASLVQRYCCVRL